MLLPQSWSKPWSSVQVQMPWLSCQRTAPAEAAVLQAARAVWGRGAAAAGAQQAAASGNHRQQQQQQVGGSCGRASSRPAVVAAAVYDASDADAARSGVALPLVLPQPPPPPRTTAQQGSTTAVTASNGSSSSSTQHAAAPPPRLPADDDSMRAAVSYQDGPLMLFVDTSALLSMLGCPGSVSSTTCCTVKLLQALAGSGR